MPGAHMLASELADELGRSTDWLMHNWRDLTTVRAMPKPLHDCGSLVWSRAQIVAWLDRDLTPPQQIAAAAFRAAAAAAAGARHGGADEADIARHRDRLERRFTSRTTP